MDRDIAAAKIDISQKWDIVLNSMRRYAEEHQITSDIGMRIAENIKKPENLENLTQALTATQTIQLDRIKLMLFDIISKVTPEINVAIKLETETIDIFQLHKTEKDYALEEAEKEEEKVELERPEEPRREIKELALIVLQSELVISPVKGVPISELQRGDQVMVRITDTRDIGIYLNKLLSGGDETQLKNIKASIREISSLPETESLLVELEFGPGILGKAYVPNDVKVLTPFSEELAKLKTDEDTHKTSPLLIIGVLIAIFIMLILIIFFSR